MIVIANSEPGYFDKLYNSQSESLSNSSIAKESFGNSQDKCLNESHQKLIESVNDKLLSKPVSESEGKKTFEKEMPNA